MDVFVDPITKDIVVENGRLKVVDEGIDAVRQRIDFRLNLLYGEWVLNTEVYVDFLNIVAGRLTPGKLQSIDSHYQEIILGAKGVRRVLSFNSTVEGRKYSAVIRVQTEDDQVLQATVTPVDFGPETFGAPEGSAVSWLQDVNVMLLEGC